VDEIMRGMQGTDDQASLARYRPLPVWVGVGMVKPSKRKRTAANKTQTSPKETRISMARMIDFHIPTNFQRKVTTSPQSGPGKVLRFCLSKKSA
jgi:hypothetical protein